MSLVPIQASITKSSHLYIRPEEVEFKTQIKAEVKLEPSFAGSHNELQNVGGLPSWGVISYMKTTPVRSASQALALGMVCKAQTPGCRTQDDDNEDSLRGVPIAFICTECYDRGHACCWMVVDSKDRRCVSCMSLGRTNSECEASRFAVADEGDIVVPTLRKDSRRSEFWFRERQHNKRVGAFRPSKHQLIATFDDALKIKADILRKPHIATRYGPIPVSSVTPRQNRKRRNNYYY